MFTKRRWTRVGNQLNTSDFFAYLLVRPPRNSKLSDAYDLKVVELLDGNTFPVMWRTVSIDRFVPSWCDAMMHVLKDFINLKYSELLTKEISKSN